MVMFIINRAKDIGNDLLKITAGEGQSPQFLITNGGSDLFLSAEIGIRSDKKWPNGDKLPQELRNLNELKRIIKAMLPSSGHFFRMCNLFFKLKKTQKFFLRISNKLS